MRLPTFSRAPLAATFLTILAGCSSPSATTSTSSGTAGGSSSSSSGSGGAGGGSACPADEHPSDAGACDTTLTWQTDGKLTPARHHHVTFIAESKAGPYLYVSGGFNGSVFLANSNRAAIQPDGSLGAWETQTALPSSRAGHMIVYGAGHAVVLGGMTGTGEIADVVSAPIDDTGALGAWTPTTPLPIVRMHGSAGLDGTTIYVVGGLGADGSAIANVERATLSADGTVSAWDELTPLPAPRSHHAFVIDGGYLYALGGLQGDPNGAYTEHTDVLRAPIQADGTIGAWTTTAQLVTSDDTASAVVHDGWLYLVGGIEGDDYVAHVRRAPLLADHTLGPWEDSAPLPKGRGHVHQTPVYQSTMYSVGGSIANLVPIPDVFRGTFQ